MAAGVHGGGTLADEDRIVRAAVRYLNVPDTGHPAPTPHPYVLSTTGAAIKLLRMVLYTPNHAWPADSNLTAWAEAQVLHAAPTILENADEYTALELIQYLGMMQSSAEAHSLLLRIADRDDNAGIQAKICLTWHPQSEDLSYLAAALIAPGDADPRGTDPRRSAVCAGQGLWRQRSSLPRTCRR